MYTRTCVCEQSLRRPSYGMTDAPLAALTSAAAATPPSSATANPDEHLIHAVTNAVARLEGAERRLQRAITRLEDIERRLQGIEQRFGDERHGGRVAAGLRTVMYWNNGGTELLGRHIVTIWSDTLVGDIAPGASTVEVDIGGCFYALLSSARLCDVAPGTLHVRSGANE